MKHGPRYRVPFQRRKVSKTDYRRRRRLLRSGLPRAIVRRSNMYIRVQFATFDMGGDLIVASAFSKELESLGWKHSKKNAPAAYLIGYLAGKRAAKAGVDKAVLDIGLHDPTKDSKVFATLKGIVDAGVEIPHSEDVLPDDDRIRGKNLDEKIGSDFEKVLKKMEAE